jgi:HEAT repeat protein
MKHTLLTPALVALALAVCGPPPAARAGDSKEIDALRDDLESDRANTRFQALVRIQDLGPKAAAATPELVELLSHEHEPTRLEAAVALSKVGKAAVPHLKKLLGDAYSEKRRYVILVVISWLGPDASELAPQVIDVLADAKGTDLRKAAQVLDRLVPPRESIPALVKLLGHNSPDPRASATKAIARLGADAVPPLLTVLADNNLAGRVEAARALGLIGPAAKEAIEPLKKRLMAAGDKESELAKAAGQALGNIGPAAVPALSEALRAPHEQGRKHAVEALGKIGGPAVQVLMAAARANDADLRREAVVQLARLGGTDARVVPVVANALQDEDSQVRVRAIIGLKTMGKAALPAAPALVAALGDTTDGGLVQDYAAAALITCRPDPKVILPGLRPLLKDPRPETRQLAVQMLHLGGPEAVPLLVAALKDHEDKVRHEALLSLLEVNGDIYLALPDVAAHLKSGNDSLRSAAGYVAEKMDARVVPHLVATLEHPDFAVRRHIVYLMTRRPADAAKTTPVLLKLARTDAGLRQPALHAVVGFGPTAWPPLLEFLGREKDEATIRDAVEGLSYYSGADELKAGLPLLTAALKQPSAPVRRFAAAALGRIGADASDAVPALMALRDDPDPAVQAQVKSALKSIQGK